MAGQLISDPKERAKRAAEKENGILTWLADFVYRGLGSNGTKNQRKRLPSPFSPFFPCISINIAIT